MKNYLSLGVRLLLGGVEQNQRNGKTFSLFSQTLDFDLRNGFPMLSTKYINFQHIVHETLWYLKGTNKLDYLHEHNIHIWDAWATDNSIGRTYGVQWRDFNGVDQVAEVIKTLKTNPDRRMIITGWNPAELNQMALPPCLTLMQFHVENNNLHMSVYQRSGDFCLGVPYDIAEMALLQTLIASVCDMTPATLSFFYGNVHMYENHVEAFKTIQLSRTTRPLPELVVAKKDNIDDFTDADIILNYYNPHGKIKYEVSK